MSLRESPITREFWQNELGGQGTLYEEFRAVEKQPGVRSWRDLDGVVVLEGPPEIQTRGRRCLDGEDIVIIQTKAAPLNPHVFGQALLSQDLIQMRWSPSSVRSVLLCTADDPDLRAVTNEFPGVEIHIRRGQRGSFGLRRLPADEVRRHVTNRGTFVASIQLTRRFVIKGILVPDPGIADRRPIREMVAGQHVTTVHSEKRGGKPAITGMYIAGEVIAAQKLLTQMGAASADSLCCAAGKTRPWARPSANTRDLPSKAWKPFGQLLAPSSCPHGRRVMDSWKGRHLSALTAPNGRRRLFGRRIDHVRT